MRRFIPDLISLGAIGILVGIFFYRLFIPVPQLLVTPDFGRSDAWHFSFATKYVLSQSLSHNTLPLWIPNMGEGFPLLAEGQTGTYFLFNLLLFKFLPVVTAYNLALVLTILLLALGTYWIARILRLGSLAALFAAVTLAFSGLPILNLPHITELQGMSLLPFVFGCTLLLFQSGQLLWAGVLALILTQQFFAGFPQATFLALILSGCYALWYAATRKRFSLLIPFGIAIILGFLGGAAQILPSWEFLHSITNPSGFNFQSAAQYSMPLVHLLTFLSPYALGSPKSGTYPPFYAFGGSVFWENTAYLGLLPLLFLGIAIVIRKKISDALFWILLLAVSLLFAWGWHSPVYLFFTVWPLNLFRVPSRFLWITIFGATMLSASAFHFLYRRAKRETARFLLILLIPLAAVQLFSSWWSYHLLIPAQKLLQPPSILSYVGNDPVYTIGAIETHEKTFLRHGWEYGNEPYLTLYTEGLGPDSNLIYHVPQHDMYAGRFLYRSQITDALLSATITHTANTATISSTMMLNILGIKHVVSFFPVDTTLSHTTLRTPAGPIRVFDNPGALPRAYLVREATTASTLTEAADALLSPLYDPRHTVLLEPASIRRYPAFRQFLVPAAPPLQTAAVTITGASDTGLGLTVNAGTKPALLVVRDTYYPGWKAYVDKTLSPIVPANIKQRAVYIPKGIHTVRFLYQPQSVTFGFWISIVTELIVAGITAALFADWRRGTSKTTHRLSSRSPRNRGT